MTVSVAVFWKCRDVENAARGAVAAKVRGTWRVATRRIVFCVKADIMMFVACEM